MQRKAQSVATPSLSKRAPEHGRLKRINESASATKENHQSILPPAQSNTRETVQKMFSAPVKSENYHGIPQQTQNYGPQPSKVQDLQSQIGQFEKIIHHILES